MTAIALWLAARARRGLWTPGAEETHAYLEIARRRLRGSLRAIAYAWLLYGFELLLLSGVEMGARAGWLEVAPSDSPHFVIVWLGGFTLALGAWSVWSVRRVCRESAALDALAREIAAGDEAGSRDDAISM